MSEREGLPVLAPDGGNVGGNRSVDPDGDSVAVRAGRGVFALFAGAFANLRRGDRALVDLGGGCRGRMVDFGGLGGLADPLRYFWSSPVHSQHLPRLSNPLRCCLHFFAWLHLHRRSGLALFVKSCNFPFVMLL